MIKCTATLRVFGPNFSPGAIEQLLGLAFSRKNEPGELSRRGRYRGRPTPYGSGELLLNVDLIAVDPNVIEELGRIVSACSPAGATSVLVHFDVAFTDQCNLEMSPEFISAMAQLRIPITITCFEDLSIHRNRPAS